jgi:hypothetical protein
MNLHHTLPLDRSSPGTIDEVFKLADFISKSDFFPAWKNKPHDAAVAILFGQSLGLSWGHSLLNIAVINGRPTVWGDAMLALCMKSPFWEDFDEDLDERTMTATCLVKRMEKKEKMYTFSLEDARTAKLLGKDNWIKYPKRMLQMRARAFALRDVFPDVLHGLGCTEEVIDYPDSTKTGVRSKSESRMVSSPASTVEVLPKAPEAEVLPHSTQKEPSAELKQFVDNLAKFNCKTPAQPKTAFMLMRERLDEQRHHQQQKGMEAVKRLKTLIPHLQQGKGV